MIKISKDQKNATIDRNTYNRLTQGTRFQRSMNLLAELDKVYSEMDKYLLKATNLSEQEVQDNLKIRRKDRAEFFRKNPPPMAGGFDMSAIDAYFG